MGVHDWYIQKYSGGEVLISEIACPDCEQTLERIKQIKAAGGDLSATLRVVVPGRATQKERAAIAGAGVVCISASM